MTVHPTRSSRETQSGYIIIGIRIIGSKVMAVHHSRSSRETLSGYIILGIRINGSKVMVVHPPDLHEKLTLDIL